MRSVDEWVEDEVRAYKSKYGEHIPVRYSDFVQELSSDRFLEDEDVDEMIADVSSFYSDLLDLEMDGDNISKISDITVYNPGPFFERRERPNLLFKSVKDALKGNFQRSAATGVMLLEDYIDSGGENYLSDLDSGSIDGMYYDTPGRLCVSLDKTTRPRAYSIGASEIFHYFQHRNNSPTVESSIMLEGLERSSKTKALQHFHENDIGGITEKQKDALFINTAVNGLIKSMKESDQRVPDLGLSEKEHSRIRAYHDERNTPRKYDMGSLTVLNAERYDEDIFQNVFENGLEAIEKRPEIVDDTHPL